MAKTLDLRSLKDKAAKAVEKRAYGKAAELYVEIAQHENDPDWRHRAGEAFRKANQPAQAAEQLICAAEGYAQTGFLLKAIAVCKVVLQLEPRHTETQRLLADLYAQRDRTTRSTSGKFELAPVAPVPAPPPVARVAPPPPMPLASPMLSSLELAPIDQLSNDETMDSVSLPPGSPMDALPLVQLFGGRKSQALPKMRLGEDPGPVGAAYEIELNEPPPMPDLPSLTFDTAEQPQLPSLPDSSRFPAVRAEEIAIEAEPTRGVGLPPLQPQGPDELDFSDVMDAPPPLRRPAPPPIPVRAAPPPPPPSAMRAPAPPPPPKTKAPPADDLDFSDLMEEPPAAKPKLPVIPLFSSLSPDELRTVIEGVEVRDFQPGQVIVRQGDRGVALYVIVQGQVQIYVDGPAGRRAVGTLGEGAFFGELALLTDFPRSATVVAEQPTQCLEVSRDLVARVIADSPDVLKVLLRFFRDRLLDRFLRTSDVFQRFDPGDAQSLLERFVFLEIEPRSRVIREGERATGLYLLLCGEAQVLRGEKTVATLQPGDVFGEMSLLERGPAAADVVTKSKCWALQLPRQDFQEIVLTYPQLLEFIAELADRRKTRNLGPDGHVEIL